MTTKMLTLQQQRERSVLVVALPTLSPLIQDIRRQATEDGPSVPPHITLYSPFFAPDETNDGVIRRIASTVDGTQTFGIRIERFPSGVWFLRPTPADPLRNIIQALRREFPEVSPYWDRYSEVVPHITLADEAVIGQQAISSFLDTISMALPIHLEVDTITWLQRRRPSPAPWDPVASFPLTSS